MDDVGFIFEIHLKNQSKPPYTKYVFVKLIYEGKKMNDDFKKIDNFAKHIYLTLIEASGIISSEDLKLPEFSKEAYKMAQTWFDLEDQRLELFYSCEKNRLDWYVEKTNVALKFNPDFGITTEHVGKDYWVTRNSDNTPVKAILFDIDDGFYLFKDPKSEKRFKINSILVPKTE